MSGVLLGWSNHVNRHGRRGAAGGKFRWAVGRQPRRHHGGVDHHLGGLSTREFEHVSQALAQKIPDGGSLAGTGVPFYSVNN